MSHVGAVLLPWYAYRSVAPKGDEHCVIRDDAGRAVVERLRGSDHEQRETAVAICNAVNRTGDRVCANCGDRAACFGSYEDELHPAYACDNCCGHGNEDGHCEPAEGGAT